MCVCQHTLISPLRMSGEEADRDRACYGIISPLQKELSRVVCFFAITLALVDRREKLVSTEICRIDLDDRLEGTSRFRNATESVECLAQLPRHFAIAWVLLRQFREFLGR